MKIRYTVIFLLATSLLVACNKASTSSNESPSQKTKTDSTLQEPVPEYKKETRPDSNLIMLAKHLKEEGYRFYQVKPYYKFQSVTILQDLQDSILYYKHDIKDQVTYYKRPFTWSEDFRRDKKTELDHFYSLLDSASACYGITYTMDKPNTTVGSMVEEWWFPNPEKSNEAKKAFDDLEYALFPKTLSFTITDSNRLYLFHSRYMGASWYNKIQFEWFESKLTTGK